MNKTPFYKLAKDSLEQQLVATKQLLNLLKQEYKIYHTNSVEPLDDIISDKKPLIVELDGLHKHWLALITAESVKADPDEITAFLKSCDEENNTSLSVQWLDLQNMARDCQKINTINGTIIALRYQSTQQTLAILRGQVPGDSVYDPQGNNTTGFSGGNALAKA